MPNKLLKSFSEKYNVPMKQIEIFWEKAKDEYGENWEAVVGTVTKMVKNYKKTKSESNFSKTLKILEKKENKIETFIVLPSSTKTVKVYRQSNKTVLVDKKLLPDFDNITLEDKYGHRYRREIPLEQFSNNQYVYSMI